MFPTQTQQHIHSTPRSHPFYHTHSQQLHTVWLQRAEKPTVHRGQGVSNKQQQQMKDLLCVTFPALPGPLATVSKGDSKPIKQLIWSGNVETVQIFICIHKLHGLSNTMQQMHFFSFLFEPLTLQPFWFIWYQQSAEEKKLAHDLHNRHLYHTCQPGSWQKQTQNMTEQTQINGSSHGLVFMT